MVKTYVQTVCLREGTEDEYRAYHADCWPAVVRSLDLRHDELAMVVVVVVLWSGTARRWPGDAVR